MAIDLKLTRALWRPLLAYAYMFICLFDFIIFPVLWSFLQAHYKGSITTPWSPITLQGGGLIHLSFGTAIGISAHSRGQEKINGVAGKYDKEDDL